MAKIMSVGVKAALITACAVVVAAIIGVIASLGGKQPHSVSQSVNNSQDVIQAGRDVVIQHNETRLEINTNSFSDIADRIKRETYRANDKDHVDLLYSTSNNMVFAVLLNYKPISNTVEAYADDHFMQSTEQPVGIRMFGNIGIISWNAYDTNVTTFTVKYIADYRETNVLKTMPDIKYKPM